MNKKFLVGSIGAVVLLMSFSPVIGMQMNSLPGGDEIHASWKHFQVTLSSDDLTFTKIQGYDLIELVDADLQINPDEPVIPVKHLRFALPIGYEAVDATVVADRGQVLNGIYQLLPGSTPVPISYTGPAEMPVKGSVYRSHEFYPGMLGRLVDTGHKSGYPIADVAVYPVQYIPAAGKLVFYQDITISIKITPQFDEDEHVKVRSRSAENMIRETVLNLVDNPEDVPESAAEKVLNGPSSLGLVEEIIITSDSLVNSYQPLAEWKTKKGIPTQVLSTSWIYANYAGEQAHDNPDKIRHCIKDYWQTKGLVYVLMGGDVSTVPYRSAYVDGYYLPADLYFSDLDGTWNADSDSRFGEYPSDQIDMYSDVYIGRAPVDSTAEANMFVNKVLRYEGEKSQGSLPTDYQLRVLFMASYLDSYTDTGVLKDTIDSESIPGRFTITKLYQRNGNLNPSRAIQEFNKGQNLAEHAGHGSETDIQMGNNYMSSSQAYGLTNAPRFTGVMYSLSCHSGDFPYSDCWAEQFVKAPNGGGFYIGNSHYGWYSPGNPANGYSADFDRRYFKELLVYNHLHAGEANGEHKDYYVPTAKGDSYYRFILYELNLFGDPETPIWLNTPGQLTVNHPATLPIGPSEFTVNVKSGGSNIQGATVCLWKDDEVYLVDQTDSSGNAVFYPDPQTEGIMYVTATKFDYLPDQSTTTVESSPCRWTYAPDDLFGTPSGGYPGWVWFSIPLDPDDCWSADPEELLGFDCGGKLWYWDKYGKSAQVYNPPFIEFDLEVGESYLFYMDEPVNTPSYQGIDPSVKYVKLGRQGWTWIGMPGEEPLGYPDFMDLVKVQYPVGGEIRTAAEDRNSGNPWINWGWSYWDTYGQHPETFTPYAPFGNNICYPWLGYRVWVNVGTAQTAEDPDQVTLIWPW